MASLWPGRGKRAYLQVPRTNRRIEQAEGHRARIPVSRETGLRFLRAAENDAESPLIFSRVSSSLHQRPFLPGGRALSQHP